MNTRLCYLLDDPVPRRRQMRAEQSLYGEGGGGGGIPGCPTATLDSTLLITQSQLSAAVRRDETRVPPGDQFYRSLGDVHYCHTVGTLVPTHIRRFDACVLSLVATRVVIGWSFARSPRSLMKTKQVQWSFPMEDILRFSLSVLCSFMNCCR